MKPLKDNINNYVNLYLNDLSDYGKDNEFILAESVLANFKTVINESKTDVSTLLIETIKNAPLQDKYIYQDFLDYLENI